MEPPGPGDPVTSVTQGGGSCPSPGCWGGHGAVTVTPLCPNHRAKSAVLSWKDGCCAQRTKGCSGDSANHDRDPGEPGTRRRMVDQRTGEISGHLHSSLWLKAGMGRATETLVERALEVPTATSGSPLENPPVRASLPAPKDGDLSPHPYGAGRPGWTPMTPLQLPMSLWWWVPHWTPETLLQLRMPLWS